jgi:tRNA G18 (ribose-2'-O)-methylase SpoU
MQAILHNIRSVHNVGSVFRTADGLGVEKLYLTGYTPQPVDRFGRKRQKFSKVALGAEDVVDWEHQEDVLSVTNTLKEDGRFIAACEPTDTAVNVSELSLEPGNTCLVFGHEVDGLPEEVIAACDQTVKVPMRGRKSSLNVAVSFGVITNEVIDK